MKIEWRYGEAEVARLAGQAEDLVRLDVELILTITNDPIEAAMRARRRIPIVMIGAALPVELGCVQSLARPGAKVTGTLARHSDGSPGRTIPQPLLRADEVSE